MSDGEKINPPIMNDIIVLLQYKIANKCLGFYGKNFKHSITLTISYFVNIQDHWMEFQMTEIV